MPVPNNISELSTTPGSNSPAGSDPPSVLDDHQRTAYAFIKQISDAQSGLASLSGNQTIAGVKTFSSAPVVPDDAFTFSKLQNIPTATILGRSTAGTGDVEALTGAQATALLSAASETVSGRVELADAAEAQALSDNTRAITPARLASALQGSNQLLSATGYQRLPGGVIIQWGNFSAVGGANTVTYPIAFPVSTFVVVATAGGNNAGNNTTSYVDGIGLTNFNLVNASGTTNNWKWIAFGR